jgi:hypothetical protein
MQRRSISEVLVLALSTAAYTQYIPCAWQRPRAGVVHDALYIDGGQYCMNTWNGTGWKEMGSPVFQDVVGGQMQMLNFSRSFEKSPVAVENTTDILAPTESVPLTGGGPYDAPIYLDGAMFVDNYELYTYGYVTPSFLCHTMAYAAKRAS